MGPHWHRKHTRLHDGSHPIRYPMNRIYNSQTNATIWRGEAYLVNGLPGELDAHLHLLAEVDVPAQVIDSATHRLVRFERMEGSEWQRGWDAVPLTPEEIEARLPRPPAEVGAGQIRVAMLNMDLADDEAGLDQLIYTIIDAALTGKDRAKARILWNRATVFRRNHPFVGLVQAALGKDDAWMDALYFAADAV